MKLSIIIVNYNTERLLRSCVESIYGGANGTPFDIWVVDNHSRDNSVAMIKSFFPLVKVIESYGRSPGLIEEVQRFVRALKSGCLPRT